MQIDFYNKVSFPAWLSRSSLPFPEQAPIIALLIILGIETDKRDPLVKLQIYKKENLQHFVSESPLVPIPTYLAIFIFSFSILLFFQRLETKI